MKRAIFFDKDGTLIVNVPYNVDPDKIVFSPGAQSALRLLKAHFDFHIVSNQAGIALGYFSEDKLLRVKQKLEKLFTEADATLIEFHFCPHAPGDQCRCRKPYPELLTKASAEFDLNLSSSWMIGDILDDVEAGKRAGCRTIFLDVGNETEWEINELRNPDFLAKDLHAAAQIILKEERLL
jgi:D-glycero-D-manno-heptose 1,7-bisphosphate phosphatase